MRNRHLARNSDGDLIVMARNVAIVILGPNGEERAVNRLLYGAKMKVDEGDKVKRGQRMAEWDPYTRPIISEVDGVIGFEELVEGQSMSETVDESTGITKRMVMDYRLNLRSASLKPSIVIKGADGKIVKLARGGDARYLLPVDSIIAVEPGGTVKAGDIVARISVESAKTRDITGGLPRVAELFEARRPKDHAIIAEISGTVAFGKDYKNKQRITITPTEEGADPVEYLIPKGKHIHLQDGDVVEKGDYIVDGNPAPHDILAIKGVEELAAYLVNEIQEVYRLQGVNINDKHIEVIVRQMLQKIDIVDPGDTGFLEGEQVDKLELEEANAKALENGGKPASRHAGASRHHQGLAADAVLLLGRLLPGDDARPHRGRRQRQDRPARRPQGERHRWPAHSGRHRRGDVQVPRRRGRARRTHHRAARRSGRACAGAAAGGMRSPTR